VKNLSVGDTVTVTVRREAYYSGYAGNSECFMEPGKIGVIGAVKVPKVRKTPGGDYFCCIDFEKHGRKWRTSVSYPLIKLIRRGGAK